MQLEQDAGNEGGSGNRSSTVENPAKGKQLRLAHNYSQKRLLVGSAHPALGALCTSQPSDLGHTNSKMLCLSIVLATFHWAPSGAKTAEDQAGADVGDVSNRGLGAAGQNRNTGLRVGPTGGPLRPSSSPASAALRNKCRGGRCTPYQCPPRTPGEAPKGPQLTTEEHPCVIMWLSIS